MSIVFQVKKETQLNVALLLKKYGNIDYWILSIANLLMIIIRQTSESFQLI